jgi:hypothetical protein
LNEFVIKYYCCETKGVIMKQKDTFKYWSSDGSLYIPMSVGKKWAKIRLVKEPPEDVKKQIRENIEKAHIQRSFLE